MPFPVVTKKHLPLLRKRTFCYVLDAGKLPLTHVQHDVSPPLGGGVSRRLRSGPRPVSSTSLSIPMISNTGARVTVVEGPGLSLDTDKVHRAGGQQNGLRGIVRGLSTDVAFAYTSSFSPTAFEERHDGNEKALSGGSACLNRR